jgi:hypothetical protein
MTRKPKAFAAGAGLVWRRQRVLWWIYVVNLVLGFFATGGMVDRAGDILNHSLAAGRLVHGFDLSAIVGLLMRPDDPLTPGPSNLFFVLLFVAFMLFTTGGVIATYFRDERLPSGPFFEACGYHFWRFVRLVIYFAIVLLPVGLVTHGAGLLYDRIDEQAISPFPAVWFFAAAAVVIVFLLVCVRLWFDMAQVIAVADDEYRMHKALRRAATLVRHNFGSLFWLYFRISLIGWLVFGITVQLWKNYMSPESLVGVLFVSQFAIVFWLATRLWQRASEALWYRQHQSAVFESAPVRSPELEPAGSVAVMR